MKINKKKRNIIISLVVIVLIIISSVLLINKSKADKNAASIKAKNVARAQQLKNNAVKTAKENAKTGTTKAGANGSTAANKATTNKNKVQTAEQKQTVLLIQKNAKIAAQEKTLTATQVKSENVQLKSSKDGMVVFVKAANFGTTADIIKDNSKFSSYKYYQFTSGNKNISAVESISKGETTLFPAQEVGTGVTVRLLDQNKKVIKELNIKLSVR